MDDEMRLLVEAMKPFVAHYDPSWMDEWDDNTIMSVFPRVTYGEARRARAAIEALSTPAVDKPTSEVERARAITDALFADIRGRKLLKWLFIADGEVHPICEHFDSIDAEVQAEIHRAWETIILAALRSPATSAGVREALEPFAKAGQRVHEASSDATPVDFQTIGSTLTYSDLRRARDVYASTPPHDVRRDALEEAAKVARDYAESCDGFGGEDDAARTIADRILALDTDGEGK